MSPSAEQSWLKFAALGVVGLPGLLIAAAAVPELAGPTEWLVDLVFWPLDDGQSLAADGSRLLAAILGGILLGFGVALWNLAGGAFDRDPAFARRAIWQSVLAWFAVDTTASIASGGWRNLIGNVVFLSAFAIPLGLSAQRRR